VRAARLGTLALALGVLACSNASNQNPPLPPTGGGGSGLGGTGMPMPPSGDVNVEIEMPMDGLVAPAGSLVDVRVRAFVDQASGTDFIEPTSVEAVVTSTTDMVELESTMLAPQGTDVFSGRISLGDRETGSYLLKVTATSSGGKKGEAMLAFDIDGGPLLVVRSPQPLHSYKGLLVIEVIADPAQFGPLDGPHATVANYPVPLSPVVDTSGNPVPNLYRGMIDLRDPVPGMIVSRLVESQLLTVWATNANGKRIERHLVFFIDEEGPQIVQTSPAPGEIVGDIMHISATVLDPSGVLDSSVIAVVGDDTTPALFNVQLKPDGAGVYSSFFDTRKLTGCADPPAATDLCIVYPTISFRASDELGNERAVGYDFTVDNIAPVADLDPPKLRSYELVDAVRCSHEFDPLSNNSVAGDMPNDRNVAPQVFDLRARIEDDGNHARGLKVVPVSLVDPNKTAVYVLDDETKPLIVDTDNDGWCDAINPLLIPTTAPPTSNDQVLKIRLAPVTPAGRADFTDDPTLPNSVCLPGLDLALPQPLCPGNQPTIAIGYRNKAIEPAIWTVEDIDADWCFGKQFDAYANHMGDDNWICIAVATADNANNVSVSAPLRVYVDYQFNGAPGSQNGPGTAPACTGTYNRATNTVSNAACKTRRFERQPNEADRYCYQRECPGPFLPL
jgi:hypothetical protein